MVNYRTETWRIRCRHVVWKSLQKQAHPLDFVLWKKAKPGEPIGILHGGQGVLVGILNVLPWQLQIIGRHF